jgi:hypothetical protein
VSPDEVGAAAMEAAIAEGLTEPECDFLESLIARQVPLARPTIAGDVDADQ